MDEEKTEQETREELEARLAETEAELERARREQAKQKELEKLEEKRKAPPKLTNVKRSRLNNEEKLEIQREYGLATYYNLPL